MVEHGKAGAHLEGLLCSLCIAALWLNMARQVHKHIKGQLCTFVHSSIQLEHGIASDGARLKG